MDTDAIEVRAVRDSEARELRRLRLRALADAPFELGPFLAEEQGFSPAYWQAIAHPDHAQRDRVAFVASRDGAFVGMVGATWASSTEVVSLVALWVDPAARGRRVGRRLVDAVLGWAQARHARRVELWVVDGNPAAHAVYAHAGFTPTGRRQAVPWAPDAMESLLARHL